MKKLYSFLSVLAVAALGVNAAPSLHKTATFTPKHQLKTTAEFKALETAFTLPEAKSTHKVAAAAADVCDMYDIEFVSFDESGESMATWKDNITVAEFVDGLLEVTGFCGDFPIYGEYDPETGLLALEPEDLDTIKLQDGTEIMVAYAVLTFDANGYFVLSANPTYNLTFNGEGFNTPQDCFLGVIGKDIETSEFLGTLDFFYDLKITRTPWENVGEATFLDGIFGPLANPENDNIEDVNAWKAYEYTIGVQRLATDPTQIRLVNFCADYGGNGHLYIDITDPNLVTVPYQETGVVINPNYGTTSLASVSVLYDNAGNLIIPEAGETIILKNNVIDFEESSIVYNFPDPSDKNINPNGFYGMKFSKASKLTLPEGFNSGVENVDVNTNDKVEYFNLQGIRVENPAHGLYIRRAGKKVEKIIL